MLITRLINHYKKKSDPIKFYKNKGMKIGKGCDLHPGAMFGSEPYLISLGNNVRVNKGVQFITHDGGAWVLRNYLNTVNAKEIDLFGLIRVGNNVHIGSNAIIMPKVKIGNNCIIGVGAIVTRDIPDNSIAVGIPAKVIETIDEYASKHVNDFDYTKSMTSEEKKKYLLNKYNLD